jgi:hypothetical protein
MLLPADAATLFNAGLVRGLNAGLTPTPAEVEQLLSGKQ